MRGAQVESVWPLLRQANQLESNSIFAFLRFSFAFVVLLSMSVFGSVSSISRRLL